MPGLLDIPVLFLDTVHHFPLTIAYRDELSTKWGLNLITLRAAAPEPGLWTRDYKACCDKHKVGPLFGALEEYDSWFTGLRRAQSPTRAALGCRAMATPGMPASCARTAAAASHW